MRKLYVAAVSAAILAASSLGGAQAQAAKTPPRESFHSSAWKGWKATPDARTLYIRVERDRLYRLDLDAACPALKSPGAVLITKLTGPWICDPLDLQMKVSEGRGFVTPCTVRKISRLSGAEARALPKGLQP